MKKSMPIKRQKTIASIVIAAATVLMLTLTIAASRGYIIPWPEKLGWFSIPTWYYHFTEITMGLVGLFGMVWVNALPEEME